MPHRLATRRRVGALFVGALASLTAFAALASCAPSSEVPPTVDAAEAGQPVEPLAGDRPAAVSTGAKPGGPSSSDAGNDDDAGVGSYAGLVVNEVDYDQVGVDEGEFVELFNGSGHAIDLEGLALVVATANAEYDRVDLSGLLAAGAYMVIASPKVVIAAGALRLPWNAASNNLRNTAAAGVAILDTVEGELIDALSYGGSVTAATLTDVTAPASFVEGTETLIIDSNTVGVTLIRTPNGSDSDDAETDWDVTTTATPGGPNVLTP